MIILSRCVKRGLEALGASQGEGIPPKRGPGRHPCSAAAQQTAGVWVAVNHPEMSLFRGLNEAPTTKRGPGCSRTACPPAPDAHNSFIQEPHVQTKAPKSIRHPATPDNALMHLTGQASNERTAFRGDQTARLALKESRGEKKHCF